MALKLILLGSPGVGKGTYTQDLIHLLHLVHVSTGDLFRENIKQGTPLGKKAKEYMDKGQLVPDSVTIEMLQERLTKEDCRKKGFILDGFPRTVPQAEALAGMTAIDRVVSFQADHQVIIGRLSGRIVCRKCGYIYHLVNLPPKTKGICDKDSDELYQRADDRPEAIEARLKEYEQKTMPLVAYYQKKGLLREVAVNEDYGKFKKIIQDRILKAIKE